MTSNSSLTASTLWRAARAVAIAKTSVTRALILAIVCAIASGLGRPAAATIMSAEGGQGGGDFQAQCAPGQYVVGFAAGAGAWINRIAILCAPYLAEQHKFGSRTTGEFHGGGGATLQEQYCPVDSYVASIHFGFTRRGSEREYVDDVGMGCARLDGTASASACINTGEGCSEGGSYVPNVFPTGVRDQVHLAFQSCPSGEAATGIHGRSGDYVDALGLICGPAPTGKIIGHARPPSQPSLIEPGAGSASSAANNNKMLFPGTAAAAASSAPLVSESAPATSKQLWLPAASAAAGGGSVSAPPASSGQPVSYPLACLGGGRMTATSGSDGFVRIAFAPAPQGSAARAPRPGQCAWSDRGFRAGEPEMLIYGASGTAGQDLLGAARRGDAFDVHAYNNGQGSMIVTSVDAIRSAKKNGASNAPKGAAPPASGRGRK
jgi:hypothetical protein